MKTLSVISIFQANITTCTGSFLTLVVSIVRPGGCPSSTGTHSVRTQSILPMLLKKLSIELQKVLSLSWKTAENHVEYFTLQCGCDLMALSLKKTVKQTLLIVLFYQQILAHMFYRGIMEFITTEGQESCESQLYFGLNQ